MPHTIKAFKKYYIATGIPDITYILKYRDRGKFTRQVTLQWGKRARWKLNKVYEHGYTL